MSEFTRGAILGALFMVFIGFCYLLVSGVWK